MISTRALDPKESVNRFGISLCKFRPHFWEAFSESLKNRQNGHFCRNFYIEIVCLCVQILVSERYIISTRSLDPKDFVNRFGDPSRKFKDIFCKYLFGPLKTPENGQNRRFLKFLKSILCACVCTYLFWGAWCSGQMHLTPKCLWKKLGFLIQI